MNKFFQLILICFLPVLISSDLSGQSNSSVVLTPDTGYVSVRQPDSSFLDSYRNNPDFDYRAEKAPAKKNFLGWIYAFFAGLLQKAGNLFVLLPVFYRVAAICLVLLFFYILISKTRISKLFYAEKRTGQVTFSEHQATDMDADFDILIEKAVLEKNFRDAIRFWYHKLIRTLGDNDLIRVSKEKSNFEYLRELKNTVYYAGFKKASGIYEYAWYGNFSVSEEEYHVLLMNFTDFLKTIHA